MSSSVAIILLPFHAHVTGMAITIYLTQNETARHRVHSTAFDIYVFRRSEYLQSFILLHKVPVYHLANKLPAFYRI